MEPKKNTKIAKNFEMIDLALWLPKSKILAITDLQLGYEEHLNKQGVFMPRVNYDEILKHLNEILKKVKPEKIIINGDLKHEFGNISEQEWREVLKLLAFIGGKCNEVIIVKGNHDTIVNPIAELKKIKVVDFYVAEKEKILFIHGHKEPAKELLKGIKTIIIGHEHPAVVITDGVKREKYKCFLRGTYKKKELIVLPSFNFVSMGTDVLHGKLLSPLLTNIEKFEVFAVEDKIYPMGKVKDLI
ncbi:MAG TPA: metallophosphoesterase [archaeon]|nr:metallophosphoesterase [archaeon]